jgi:hypothetical protein
VCSLPDTLLKDQPESKHMPVICLPFAREREMKLLQIIKMVLWSFFGVRKRSGMEADIKANPGQVIFVAILAAIAFIGILFAAVFTALHVLA